MILSYCGRVWWFGEMRQAGFPTIVSVRDLEFKISLELGIWCLFHAKPPYHNTSIVDAAGMQFSI
jgi:hypothetical protein